MNPDKDRLLMRAKDVILVVGAVGGLLAGMGKIFVLAEQVEIQEQKISAAIPTIYVLETRMAVNDERWAQVQLQLERINRKLDK